MKKEEVAEEQEGEDMVILDFYNIVYSEGYYMWSSKQPSRVDRKEIYLLISVSSVIKWGMRLI